MRILIPAPQLFTDCAQVFKLARIQNYISYIECINNQYQGFTIRSYYIH
jgi:hypothetical protein